MISNERTTTLTAELARTVLDSPGRVQMLIDDEVHALGAQVGVELQDDGGTSTLVCIVAGRGAELAEGRIEVRVVSSLASGASLIVTGPLRWVRRESCDCCGEIRSLVAVDLDEVRLERGSQWAMIETAAFTDPTLGLNPGFLRRTQDHINESHVPELCEAIGQRCDTPTSDIVAAQLVDLGAGGVELQWVTIEGSERVSLRFATRARTRTELGHLLRGSLDLHC